MLHSILKLRGFQIDATDGELGVVEDLYIDDGTWALRYLVVRAGPWLTGRKVLISPHAVLDIQHDRSRVSLDLTQRQVRDSPDISVDLPVSRQIEARYHSHYGWPAYWGGPFAWGAYPYPGMVADAYPPPVPPESPLPEGDPHLRSAMELKGYRVNALGSAFGELSDFLMDEEDWSMRYFVIDTSRVWGHQVLVPVELVESVRWDDRALRFSVGESVVRQAPIYDPAFPVDRSWEKRVHGYFGLPLRRAEERRAV